MPKRRPSDKLAGYFEKVEVVLGFEGRLPHAVLLEMMITAQADAPFIGGFEVGAAVGSATDMRAFDGKPATAGD